MKTNCRRPNMLSLLGASFFYYLFMNQQLFAQQPCNYCNSEVNTGNQISGELLHISMRWCGLEGAPSVDSPQNPFYYCNYSDFKTMLWRRHERASDCIWIDQCKITLRSGGSVTRSDYFIIDESTQNSVSISSGNISSITEAVAIADICDNMSVGRGIAAVSANSISIPPNNLLGAGGDLAAMVTSRSETAPYIVVADPVRYCDSDGDGIITSGELADCERERYVGVATGFALGLNISGDFNNLMRLDDTGITIEMDQCEDARMTIEGEKTAFGGNLNNLIGNNNDIFESFQDSNVDSYIDALIDLRPFADTSKLFLDIRKQVVVDNSPIGGDLEILFKVNGIIPDSSGLLSFNIDLDIDNSLETGISGYDFRANVVLFDGEIIDSAIFIPQDGIFTRDNSLNELVQASHRIIDLILIPYLERPFDGPTTVPIFSEFEIVIDTAAFASVGLPVSGMLFPDSLRTRIISLENNEETIDSIEGTLGFPEIIFPYLQAPDTASRREEIEINVVGMTPDKELTAFFGQFEINPQIVSDSEGNATFNVVIPADASLGYSLLTIGINDPLSPNNAVTADDIIFITDIVSVNSHIDPAKLKVFPNPFDKEIHIEYELDNMEEVVMEVYSLEGRQIYREYLGQQIPGLHRLKWEGITNDNQIVPSGMYFLSLQLGSLISNQKILFIE